MGILRGTYTLGALVRGHFRRELKTFCFQQHYELEMIEDKRWLDTTFYVTIRVPDADLMEVARALDAFCDAFSHTA